MCSRRLGRRVAPRYRLCPKCKYRYERVKKKCPSCAAPRPKKRVAKHAETLRDHDYDYYYAEAQKIHGITKEQCCVCGRLPSTIKKLDREHGHKVGDPAYGKPRGITCSQCNMLMKFTQLDAHRARLIYEYLQRVHDYYTKPEGQVGSSKADSP